MRTWRREDLEGFFRAFDGYWPGRLRLEEQGELLKTWRDVAQRFDVQVAMGALRELYEGQATSRAPTPAGFKSSAGAMQAFVNERARLAVEERRTGERLFTAQEIAADDQFWEERFDSAPTPGQLEWLKRTRRRLSGGGSLVGHLASGMSMPEEPRPRTKEEALRSASEVLARREREGR